VARPSLTNQAGFRGLGEIAVGRRRCGPSGKEKKRWRPERRVQKRRLCSQEQEAGAKYQSSPKDEFRKSLPLGRKEENELKGKKETRRQALLDRKVVGPQLLIVMSPLCWRKKQTWKGKDHNIKEEIKGREDVAPTLEQRQGRGITG